VVGAIILVSVMEALRFMEISPLIVGFARQIAQIEASECNRRGK
jgi:hypothetical protein